MGVTFRRASRDDVWAIVGLLADDDIGRGREQAVEPLAESYWRAFDAIAADARQLLVVGDDQPRRTVVATMQISFIPYMSYGGGERAQIENVRVAGAWRGQGVGHQMITWAVDRAHERGCRLMQLTTDNRRFDARRFYERLGFRATHLGMKLPL